MKTKQHFIETFNYCKENQLYIGTGNPEAPILIIGKECAKPSKGIVITPEILKKMGGRTSRRKSNRMGSFFISGKIYWRANKRGI